MAVPVNKGAADEALGVPYLGAAWSQGAKGSQRACRGSTAAAGTCLNRKWLEVG